MSFDVFEHMTDKQIIDVFKKIKSDYIIVKIPCSTIEKEIELAS
jgi:hypothetical protein